MYFIKIKKHRRTILRLKVPYQLKDFQLRSAVSPFVRLSRCGKSRKPLPKAFSKYFHNIAPAPKIVNAGFFSPRCLYAFCQEAGSPRCQLFPVPFAERHRVCEKKAFDFVKNDG
ncbi:hypothetical protein [Oscillibacter sp. PC13]|uniref:hypothetical protein n=1 Tax=Oscillibacter sp. PC13 TaxID=1855299 RepID=UPI000B870619|nr:hypothetical protein [Oscillibacter sp. PC13]